MSGRCLEYVWSFDGGYQEGVLKLSGRFLDGTPENIWDQRSSQVRSSQDRPCQEGEVETG